MRKHVPGVCPKIRKGLYPSRQTSISTCRTMRRVVLRRHMKWQLRLVSPILLTAFCWSMLTVVGCQRWNSDEITEAPIDPTVATTGDVKVDGLVTDTAQDTAIFSPSTIRKDLPSNVVGELMFYAGGEGGVADFFPDCSQAANGPSLQLPKEEFKGIAGDRNTTIYGTLCDFPVDETIQVTITNPAGLTVYQEALISKEYYGPAFNPFAELKYQPPYPSLVGTYTITVQGSGVVITETVEMNLLEAKSPLAIFYDDHVALHNFAANERVRLTVYDTMVEDPYLGWFSVQVGADGQGFARVDGLPCIRVLGDVSGLVPHLFDRCLVDSTGLRQVYGVVVTDESTVPVYSTDDDTVIYRVTPGTIVEVMGYIGPLGRYVVRLSNGIVGQIFYQSLRSPLHLEVRTEEEAAPLYEASWSSGYLCPGEIVDWVPAGTEFSLSFEELDPFYCVLSGIRYWTVGDSHLIRAEDVVVVPDPQWITPQVQADLAAATSTPVESASFAPDQLPPFDPRRPEDILQEVAFFPGAGGGGGVTCYDRYEAAWNTHRPHALEAVTQWEWLDLTWVSTCGWTPQENITVTIWEVNSGVLDLREVKADDWGGATIDFLLDPSHAPGTYHFTFSGATGEVMAEIRVNPPPPGPILYKLANDQEGMEHLLFLGFQSDEPVRLLAYKQDPLDLGATFSGWLPVQVESDGSLRVSVPKEEGVTYYAAIGEHSGQARYLAQTNYGLFPIPTDPVSVP